MRKYMIADCISEGQAYGVRKGICLPGTTRQSHCHEFLEIVFVSSGRGIHYIGDRSYDVKRGTLMFIGCDQAHSFTASETMTYMNFYINPSAVSGELVEIRSIWELLEFLFPEMPIPDDIKTPRIEINSVFLSEMQACADGIHREMSAKRYGYSLAVDGYMRIIYTGLIRALVPPSSNRRKILSPDVLEYVEKNFTKRITLIDLAGKFFYSPVYLGKLFKSTYGVSFKAYVLEKRLDLAASLLLSSDITVSDVAGTVGFSDKKFFYHCFEQKFGCTPLKYRKG